MKFCTRHGAIIFIGLLAFRYFFGCSKLSFRGEPNKGQFGKTLGFLKYIFNNPQMHLWHHAEHVPNRYGVNFGLTLSVWDYIFGTAYIPHEGKDEKLGFDKLEEFPKTFWSQMIYPLKK